MSFVKGKMEILPAVDIKNGKCVQLVQGKPGSEQVIIDNPEEVARKWEDIGADVVHVIDLDGTIDGKSNLSLIEKIYNNVDIPIQLGGGIRSVEYAEKLLDIGIERLIIGTMGIEHPETVRQLSDEYGSEHIMVSLDSKDSKVVIKGWQEKIDKSPSQLAEEFADNGAGSILFTNVDVEGLLGGFYTDPVVELVESSPVPVVYSGGVSSLDDLEQLQKTGVSGVVIGSALYKNKIDLRDALKYQYIN